MTTIRILTLAAFALSALSVSALPSTAAGLSKGGVHADINPQPLPPIAPKKASRTQQ